MKTYVFDVVIEEEKDGRFSAICPALPGCASWGYTEQEALRNIREAVEVYVEDLIASGETIPIDREVFKRPAVSVVA